MLVRVRSNTGMWRVELDEATATLDNLKQAIVTVRPHIEYEKPLCTDPACTNPIDPTQTLLSQNIGHGTMVYCRVNPATAAEHTVGTGANPPTETSALPATASTAGDETATNSHMKRIIDKDGSIKLVPTTEVQHPGADKGFRKGMLPLRDMKMQWTLADFVALDSQFEFKMQRQESAFCQQASLDIPSISDFQSYLKSFDFKRKRFGILYGKFVENDTSDEMDQGNNKPLTKARIEAIYEPPQEPDAEAAEGFQVLDDPDEERVDKIASMLGLTKVGWIYGHEPREKGFVMSAAEVIMAAEFQLEAAGGVEDTPFVTIKVAPTLEKSVSVEAFQVSRQCMAMVAEEALEIGPDPKECVVNETFTAIQEGKPSKTVENNFFLCVVPIVQHTSEVFCADFPRCNRDVDVRMPSHDEMKRQLQKAGTEGWTFVDRLADFNLLIYLSRFLDLDADFPKICASVVDRSIPLDDGYKIIIKSMAGMDGSY